MPIGVDACLVLSFHFATIPRLTMKSNVNLSFLSLLSPVQWAKNRWQSDWQVKAVVLLFTTLSLSLDTFSIYKSCCRLLMTDSHQLPFQSDWTLKRSAFLVHLTFVRSHRRPIDYQFLAISLYHFCHFLLSMTVFSASLCIKILFWNAKCCC